MKIEKTIFDDVVIVKIIGDFDYFQCTPFLKAIEENRELGFTKVVLHLVDVPFINSTAIGAIVRIKNELDNTEGGALAIAEPSEFVANALDTVGLKARIPHYDKAVDALKALLEGAPADLDLSEGETLLAGFEEGLVLFRFNDDFKAGLFGKRTGAGTIQSVTTKEVVFRWPRRESDQEVEAPSFDSSQVFEATSTLDLKFSLKLLRKDYYFKVTGGVTSAVLLDDNRIEVKTKLRNLSKDDEKWIQQFSEDQAVIREQAAG